MPKLPESLLTRPVAHRAFWNLSEGRPENSVAAVRAAAEKGFGIEIDLQLSADGVAMVFHDYDLGRLTGASGPVAAKTAVELSGIALKGGDEGIPTLTQVLAATDGRVPLLIEIKDQDGALGPDIGPLEEAVARALDGYGGDVALMSFNPHSVARMAELLPNVPRGLTTDPFRADDWPVAKDRLERLRDIPDFDAVGSSFISHNRRDLDSAPVTALKARGVPVLCWTIRSPDEEAEARRIADNVTFEGYMPA
ncbi:phosphodiesterase [Alphaproteobacteria bacterium GH1-50]|uniref:Phosphodiesterase n=1 Tax=Kangsaoukella pontilimi TaxID=2691042 RepID=A0A7C9J5P5_9RHOB|nr:glycerophosphodiester phosphodiesterase family protein [Kangsaoukella pontilimi]MXQ09501.1 phosphodiesterase [Kangsaoukella pontilimi]